MYVCCVVSCRVVSEVIVNISAFVVDFSFVFGRPLPVAGTACHSMLVLLAPWICVPVFCSCVSVAVCS